MHQRKNLRLASYDYSQSGMYFVTVVTHDRLCLFGNIVDNSVSLNLAGNMIETFWNEIPKKFSHIGCDEFIVMPNHVHGIIRIVQSNSLSVGVDLRVDPSSSQKQPDSQPIAGLPQIVQWFKTMTTNAYIRGVSNQAWQPFSGKLWQRNYYEHIIRNEEELLKIREYIRFNASKWDMDNENPFSNSKRVDTQVDPYRIFPLFVGADLRVRPSCGQEKAGP